MPTLQELRDKPTDPLATLFGGGGIVASLLHVPSRIGLDADEFGLLVFTLFTMAAAVRTLVESRKKKAAA
jgi:hypothetical protein